jgi:LacI family transcriptional regulator
VSPSTPDEDAKHFIEDIKDLPRPIAVFACNDIVAKDVVDFLELASVRIPSEVAVLGVDDQREICETAAVKLSSIRVEHKRLGRTAMTLMLRMLQGGEHHDKTILCPAVRVIERESTRRLAPSNPRVAAALDFIRATDPRKLSAENVSAASNSSHSYLSKSFKRETGMTIMDAIHEKILDETKRLLTETDIPVAAIAEEMGFNNPSGLYALFKRKTGSTMSEFRKNRPLL